MDLLPVCKLILSERAFLKAELDHVDAKHKVEKGWETGESYREKAIPRIKDKRRRLFRSAIWVTSLVVGGAITALLINSTAPVTWFWVRAIRGLSIVLLAWAVWSRVGDMETWKGRTLLELSSERLYQIFYSLGVFMGSIALFLKGIDAS